VDRTFERFSTEVEDIFQRWDQEVSRVGGEYQRQATIVWEEYQKEIDRIWDEFRRTTAKVWANYSGDTAARTIVDFEQGTIDVEVVVPSADPNARQKAEERVREKFLETFARSEEGAIGLMQLIPHAAARDAYQALYGEPRTVPADYLYNPENNVNLGTVYVTLLRDRHLGDVQDTVTREYLVICAYNWGIGNVKRLVSQPNGMSREEVAAILRSHTPQETQDYLDKILSRTTLYEPMAAGQ
jgi:hypothetical protein